jgi:hypothetical protein
MIPGSERRPSRVECGTPPEAAASAPFPIVEQIPVCLGADARERAVRTAAELLESEPQLSDVAAFGEGVCSGLDGGTSLIIEDHSALRLFERLGNLAYTYRALLLARPGDLVVIGLSRSPGFERYCADTLGLGEAEIVEPAPGGPTDSLTSRCTRDAAVIERLARHARRHGSLNVVPYMGTGGVWALAGMISEHSGSPVRVAAPPPRLVRRVNDKIWFSSCVDRLIGAQATPVGESAGGSAMLTAKVAAFARSHASVAIKLPDSASSKGNLVFDAASLRGRPLSRLRRHLDESMRRAGWRDEYPVLVSAWEQPVLASPSVHLWIPLTGSGDVIVEAVFDQQVVGAGGEFAGAAPSALPSVWQRRLASEAALIGLLFQRLGYFGRCSFDAIVVGPDPERALLHWIECNGRWGGVSLPMTLASRLFGDWRRQPFVIIEQSDLCGPPRTFADAVARLGDDLYVAGGEPKGAVILSPWQLEQGTGYELMVFDADVERAGARARRIAASIRDWR